MKILSSPTMRYSIIVLLLLSFVFHEQGAVAQTIGSQGACSPVLVHSTVSGSVIVSCTFYQKDLEESARLLNIIQRSERLSTTKINISLDKANAVLTASASDREKFIGVVKNYERLLKAYIARDERERRLQAPPPPEALPLPDEKRFSIGVLHIKNDRDKNVEGIILRTLDAFSSIQAVEFDRTIDTTNPDRGREQARALAKQSGFDVVIWGTYLAYNGKSKTTLSWTTADETIPSSKELSLSDAFDFTADSWQQLSDVLGLVTATSATALIDANEGAYVEENKLYPFIKRMHTLLISDASKNEISSEVRAKISFFLGNALYTLGEQSGHKAPLEEAAAAYAAALQEYTHARMPLEWAATQNNLGNALKTLGEREAGTVSLRKAVEAYDNALLVYTRERVPLEWATIQSNLGVALARLGERASGAESLHKAVEAYTNALQERTRERVPLEWAATQNNLGNALERLGARESGTASLQKAVDAFTAALQERTRERVPLDWAATQNNLGTALVTLGARESGTASLQKAEDAFTAALQERTRERVPLDWAATRYNLGTALATLGERESGTANLQKAVDAFTAALQERTRERVPLDWAATRYSLGTALTVLGERESGTASLQKAVDAFTAALQVDTRERVPLDWAGTELNLGVALTVLGEREAGTTSLQKAVAAYNNALLEFTFSADPYDRGKAQSNLNYALGLLKKRGVHTGSN